MKSEIDDYDSYYSVMNIFLDEAATDSSALPYYQDLYSYIKNKSTSAIVITNQGTVPDDEGLSSNEVNGHVRVRRDC